VRLFDGRGGEIEAILEGMREGRALLRAIEAPVPVVPAGSGSKVLLLPALVKGPAFERVLRMATELGVSAIRPFLAVRSCERNASMERWKRVLAGAATQCGRAVLPELRAPLTLGERLREDLPETRLLLVPGAAVLPDPRGDRALLLGPEGGLTPEETSLCAERGFLPAGLGRFILRADTAAAAALARYGLEAPSTPYPRSLLPGSPP
jgi:16S rRNA (uracil1498-N3)-methyltransferase